MNLDLSGKTAIVTGGSAGIGLAIARQLALEGVSVAICGRHADRLEKAAASLRKETAAQIEPIQADVTVVADVERLTRTADERLGGIDILVNNAGTGIYKPFLDVTEDELRHAMEMNFFAMFRVTQRVVSVMIRRGGGSIVNVTGTSGSSVLDPPFFSTCGGPAKAAENRFTKALAVELGPSNIRVNCVAPGRINAPERLARWREKIVDKPDQAQLESTEQRRIWGQRICLPEHRWGEVEEIAKLVTFAASPACGFMTGARLVADGGETRD
jgi:3-oxoacyl-[acyl-carrier protein] reductase